MRRVLQQGRGAYGDGAAFFQNRKAYAEELQAEKKRAVATGLREAELELFNLLFVPNLKPGEEINVKRAVQHLLESCAYRKPSAR